MKEKDESLLLKRSYRAVIREVVEVRIATGQNLSFSKLAEAARIQRTYLSQVMNFKHHLSNDQLYAICRVLGLDSEFNRHLQLLSEWERCKVEERRAYLQSLLNRREAAIKGVLAERRAESLLPDALDDYFCDPLGEVVLQFLSMERFRKNPRLIQERLGASSKRWGEILVSLRDSGFIAIVEDGIRVLKAPLHPKEDSAAEKLRNVQGRLKVAQQKLKQRNIDEFLYNWTFLSNPERKRRMKIAFLHLLQDIYKESLEVPHEDVYQLSIDLLSP